MRIAGLVALAMVLCAGTGCSHKSQQDQDLTATQPAASATQVASPSDVSVQLLKVIRAVNNRTKSLNDGAKEIAPLLSERFESDIKGYENSPEGFLHWFRNSPTTQPADKDILFAGTLRQFDEWSTGSERHGELGELQLVERKYSLSEQDVYVLINDGYNLWVFRSGPGGWKLIVALK